SPSAGHSGRSGHCCGNSPANGPTAHVATAHEETVLTPFPDVAEHVVEPPRVGRLLTDGVRLSARIVLMPRNVLRFTMPWLGASRPGGVFPLRFRRQPILPVVREHPGFAVEPGELLTVLLRLVPGHQINRCIPNRLMARRIRACDRFILL